MGRRAVKRRFPGATAYTDRHGKRRWRYRKGAFSAELGSDYGSEDFIARYEAALDERRLSRAAGAGTDRTIPGSISALVASFYRSPEFLSLAEATKTNYRGIIEPFRAEHGHRPVAGMRPAHVAAILAKKAETPGAANNLRKRLRQLMKHAIFLEWRGDNPVLATRPYRSGPGFHTWTEGEIARFYARHAPGSVAYTAMTLMLYTGAARVDAVRLGWANIAGARLRYRRSKTETTGGDMIDIPLHPDLAATLDALPRDAFTFLQTERGASRSPNGLGNLMREWCDEAGLSDCTAHGLRKAIARRLAEAGASANEIAAVTGHKTLGEVARYTKEAEKSGMADSAMSRLPDQSERAQKVANLSERFVNNSRNGMKTKGK